MPTRSNWGTKAVHERCYSRRGLAPLGSAVEQALSLGCHDVAAIRHLMLAEQFDRPVVAAVELGPLARYERMVRLFSKLAIGSIRLMPTDITVHDPIGIVTNELTQSDVQHLRAAGVPANIVGLSRRL
jgi:hypothetical protein